MQLDYDEEVGHRAVQKIHDLTRRPEPQPFFLTVSFSQPHSPFVASREHWDRYEEDDIDMPEIPPLSLDEMDAHSRRLHHMFHIDEYTIADADIRNARRAGFVVQTVIARRIGSSALDHALAREISVEGSTYNGDRLLARLVSNFRRNGIRGRTSRLCRANRWPQLVAFVVIGRELERTRCVCRVLC